MRCPRWPPRLLPLGGVGGFRFIPIGSDEGGLDELVELSLSRASRSRTRVSSSSARCCIATKTKAMAVCASGGTLAHYAAKGVRGEVPKG